MEKKRIAFLFICIFAIFALVSCNFELPNKDDDVIGDGGSDDENSDNNQTEEQEHVHEYTWTIQQDATCIEDGVELGTCSCGQTTTRTIESKGHTEVIDAAVAATCKATGLTEGKHCGVCKEVLVAQEEVAITDHSWEDETTGNVITYSCSVCGETKTEIISVYDVANGSVDEFANGVCSTAANTMAVYHGGEFAEGTISVDITLGNAIGDNGIIFGLKNTTGSDKFWEGSGVTYYVFFISMAGTAYLGKTVNGQWIVCGIDNTTSFALNKTYNLTVSRDKSNADYDVINCYVDGTLHVSYKDNTAIDGAGYGIRSGVSGIKYSNFEISDEVMGSNSTLEGYYVANVLFENNAHHGIAP